MRRILSVRDYALILAILIVGISIFQSAQSSYTSFNFTDRVDGLTAAYRTSQYVQKESPGWIPDETINTYAGYQYVQGVPPILVAPDTPPLGRYLIGLSILVTNNENIIVLVFALVMVYLLAHIGLKIYRSRTTMLVLIVCVLLEPLIQNQLRYVPLLDLFQVVFLLASLTMFNSGVLSKKRQMGYFAVASFFLGCFIATKFFITGITIVAAWYGVLLYHKNISAIIRLTVTLPIALVVLLSSYITVFTLNYSVREFLGIQKWVYLYHHSQLIHPLSFWPLVYLNRWYVWWGDQPTLSDPQWQFSWPLITTITLLFGVYYFLQRHTKFNPIETYIVWSISYILFISVGQITSRYLIVLIPVLYIVSLKAAEEFLVKYLQKR